MRVIVTRPAADAAPLRRKLEGLGHQVILQPLLAIVPRPGVSLPIREWQAVAATSANGIRSLANAGAINSLRMLTVGPQSLRAAREKGFTHAEAHGGDVAGLAAFITANLDPSKGPILYLSGSETTGDLAGMLRHDGFDCLRLVTYDAVAAADLGPAASALRQRTVDAVLLYSPRSSRIWHRLVGDAGLQAEAAVPIYLCLSPNVASALPTDWRKSVAKTPDEAALLTLLEQIARTR
jgi:uroporphyrinogen-III synthase